MSSWFSLKRGWLSLFQRPIRILFDAYSGLVKPPDAPRAEHRLQGLQGGILETHASLDFAARELVEKCRQGPLAYFSVIGWNVII